MTKATLFSMTKAILVFLSLIIISSCTEDLKKKKDEILGKSLSDSIATNTEKKDLTPEMTDKENLADLPLLVFNEYGTSYWYAPLGYIPSSQLSGDDFYALSEEKQEAENERGRKEVEAFVRMLKSNKKRYTMVVCAGKRRTIDYVSCNFDKGNEGTLALGRKGSERDEQMQYVCFKSGTGHYDEKYNVGMALPEDYLKTHKLVDCKYYAFQEGDKYADKQMTKDVKREIEKRTGKKVRKARLNGEADGGKYRYYTVFFTDNGKKAFAMQAVTTPDGVVLGEMEQTIYDEYGDAQWAVDMEGDYPGMSIVMAEEYNGNLRLWYVDTAPEHTNCGTFTVKGNKLIKREYYGFYVMVD